MSAGFLKRLLPRPTPDEVIAELWGLAKDPGRNDSARVQAMRTILEVDGQIGRASVHLHAHLQPNPLIGLSDEELHDLAAKAREAISQAPVQMVLSDDSGTEDEGGSVG